MKAYLTREKKCWQWYLINFLLPLVSCLALGTGDLARSAPHAESSQHPGLVWARSMGGSTNDEGHAIFSDSEGNIYTTGFFRDTVDFDPGTGSCNLVSAGSADIFISKLDSSGNFVWAKRMGGTGSDIGNAVHVDASGYVYTTGQFEGTVDFDPGTGIFEMTSAGQQDIFVSKLDSLGNFVWAKRMGGTGGYDIGNSIYVDGLESVYTVGSFSGTADFDPGSNSYDLTSAGSQDIFVSKLNSAGDWVWAVGMGGSTSDYANSVYVDGAGNVYSTGLFSDTADFDPGTYTYTLTSSGAVDIFVSKLDSMGSNVWARAMGGAGSDIGGSIYLDSGSNIYTTGYFSATADFDPLTGTYTLTSAGLYDIFVSKLDSVGSNVWARKMGGEYSDVGKGVFVDGLDNVYTTGYFSSNADFDPLVGVYNLISTGSNDIFVSKLNSFGSFIWAGSMGGYNQDSGSDIFIDGFGCIYTTGNFRDSADFDPGPGNYDLTSSGSLDIFISKLQNIHTVFLPLVLRNLSP